MNTMLLVALLAVAQPIATSPPKVVQLPMARQMSDDYSFARNLAIAQGKPIVYFVGIDKRPITGVVVARLDKLDGYPMNSIVVGVPDSTLGLRWAATLPSDATDAQIRRAVSPPAPPFFQRLKDNRSERLQDRLLRIADGSPNARQLPDWLSDGVRYHHAENTQAIYVLNDQQTIEPIARERLERKWQFPGGLSEIGGWKSDLYRSVPYEPEQRQVRLPVKNSLGYIQQETGWHRTYPDGSWFADVLSTEGNVFEVRVREKKSGVWESYVAYRNSRYYPVGYVPVKSSECAGCHNQAGTGEYGVGLVPGSDTVLSDPFDALQ